jgi:hypothetical protein
MADKDIPTLTDASAITARVSAHIVQGGNSREYSGAMGRWILLGGSYTNPGVWNQGSDGNVSSIIFTGLGEAADILIMMDGFTLSVSGKPQIQLSTNNGTSYFSTSGNYSSVSSAGVLTNSNALTMTDADATAARTCQALILGANVTGVPKTCLLLNRGVAFRFNGSNSPINALKIIPANGGNFTGGAAYCFVRA